MNQQPNHSRNGRRREPENTAATNANRAASIDRAHL